MKKAGKFVAVILMSLVAGIILGLAILPSGIGGGLCAGYLFEAFTRATTWMDSALSLVRSTMWGAIAYGYWQWSFAEK